MGFKLAQVPSSIFFHEDPYSKYLCNRANKRTDRQMLLKLIAHWCRYKFPFLLTKPPHFSDIGGELPPHFKISRFNTGKGFTVLLYSTKSLKTSICLGKERYCICKYGWIHVASIESIFLKYCDNIFKTAIWLVNTSN